MRQVVAKQAKDEKEQLLSGTTAKAPGSNQGY
jgi:hypothetical protein